MLLPSAGIVSQLFFIYIGLELAHRNPKQLSIFFQDRRVQVIALLAAPLVFSQPALWSVISSMPAFAVELGVTSVGMAQWLALPLAALGYFLLFKEIASDPMSADIALEQVKKAAKPAVLSIGLTLTIAQITGMINLPVAAIARVALVGVLGAGAAITIFVAYAILKKAGASIDLLQPFKAMYKHWAESCSEEKMGYVSTLTNVACLAVLVIGHYCCYPMLSLILASTLFSFSRIYDLPARPTVDAEKPRETYRRELDGQWYEFEGSVRLVKDKEGKIVQEFSNTGVRRRIYPPRDAREKLFDIWHYEPPNG